MTKELNLSAYKGNNELILSLSQLMESRYSQLFKAVIVHGSIGNGDEIRYSDFDGLLIVKDAEWESRQLRDFIRSSQKQILKYDPLQHHGWFVIRESQLLGYPQDYLPYQVLENAKLIWPKKPVKLELELKEQYDFVRAFAHLSSHLLSKVDRNWMPQNMYQLKSFLSEIMLLPCLFISALDQSPVLKEHSFALAEHRFANFNWGTIHVASSIRLDWQYRLSPVQRFIMTRPQRFWRKITEKQIAPKIDPRFADKLNNKFHEQLQTLIGQMKTEAKL